MSIRCALLLLNVGVVGVAAVALRAEGSGPANAPVSPPAPQGESVPTRVISTPGTRVGTLRRGMSAGGALTGGNERDLDLGPARRGAAEAAPPSAGGHASGLGG